MLSSSVAPNTLERNPLYRSVGSQLFPFEHSTVDLMREGLMTNKNPYNSETEDVPMKDNVDIKEREVELLSEYFEWEGWLLEKRYEDLLPLMSEKPPRKWSFWRQLKIDFTTPSSSAVWWFIFILGLFGVYIILVADHFFVRCVGGGVLYIAYHMASSLGKTFMELVRLIRDGTFVRFEVSKFSKSDKIIDSRRYAIVDRDSHGKQYDLKPIVRADIARYMCQRYEKVWILCIVCLENKEQRASLVGIRGAGEKDT